MKPRLVLAYPDQQEDALLEGYMARYLSDKVSSVTLDLYSEGTLKKFLDVTIKGQFFVAITFEIIFYSFPPNRIWPASKVCSQYPCSLSKSC